MSTNTTEATQSPTNKQQSKSNSAADVRYDADIAALVCERIATTPQSLVEICEAPDMPGIATLFRWLHRHPEFREMYVIAKQEQVEILMDECLQIVDDTSNDVIVTDDGRTILNPVAVQRARLQVNFRQWIASKLHPRKYGVCPHLYSQSAPRQPETQTLPPQSPQVDTRGFSRELLAELQKLELSRKLAARAAQPSEPADSASRPPKSNKT